MTTTAIDPDRLEARLTNLENSQMDTRERLARVEAKVDTLTTTVRETNRETNRRIDRLFYLGAATGAGIIAALLLQPLIAALSS